MSSFHNVNYQQKIKCQSEIYVAKMLLVCKLSKSLPTIVTHSWRYIKISTNSLYEKSSKKFDTLTIVK